MMRPAASSAGLSGGVRHQGEEPVQPVGVQGAVLEEGGEPGIHLEPCLEPRRIAQGPAHLVGEMPVVEGGGRILGQPRARQVRRLVRQVVQLLGAPGGVLGRLQAGGALQNLAAQGARVVEALLPPGVVQQLRGGDLVLVQEGAAQPGDEPARRHGPEIAGLLAYGDAVGGLLDALLLPGGGFVHALPLPCRLPAQPSARAPRRQYDECIMHRCVGHEMDDGTARLCPPVPAFAVLEQGREGGAFFAPRVRHESGPHPGSTSRLRMPLFTSLVVIKRPPTAKWSAAS